MPVGETGFDDGNPVLDAGLYRVDLLAAADQANHNRPVRVPVQTTNQKLGLRLAKVGLLLFSEHEVCGLFQIPGPLRLIKDRDMLVGRFGVGQQVIPEMMNILNEGFNIFLGIQFFNNLSDLF